MDDLNEIVTCVCVYLIASAIFSEASRYLAVYLPRISIEQEIASRKSRIRETLLRSISACV